MTPRSCNPQFGIERSPRVVEVLRPSIEILMVSALEIRFIIKKIGAAVTIC